MILKFKLKKKSSNYTFICHIFLPRQWLSKQVGGCGGYKLVVVVVTGWWLWPWRGRAPSQWVPSHLSVWWGPPGTESTSGCRGEAGEWSGMSPQRLCCKGNEVEQEKISKCFNPLTPRRTLVSPFTEISFLF